MVGLAEAVNPKLGRDSHRSKGKESIVASAPRFESSRSVSAASAGLETELGADLLARFVLVALGESPVGRAGIGLQRLGRRGDVKRQQQRRGQETGDHGLHRTSPAD